MFGFPSREVVERLRKEYPEGTRLSLISMDDPYSKLVPGDRGTVTHVDDGGTIHMRWDRGSSLGLAFGEDSFRKLTDEELSEENSQKDIREQLWEKASKEQSEYTAELQKLTPEQIIEKCYETVMREDILLTFEYECNSPQLSNEQVKALLKMKYPIDACYNAWQKSDVTYMDRIQETVDKFSEKEAKKESEKQKNKKRHEPER